MIPLVLFALITIFGFLYYLKQNRIYKEIELIPGPRPLPFIGNLLEFGTNNVELLLNLKRLSQRYGSVVRLCIGSQVHILLTEPKYIAQVLILSKGSEKPDFYNLVKVMVGEGLVTNSGETWYRHRRIMTQTFSNKHLEEYMTVFNKNANKLVDKLKGLIDLATRDVAEHIYNCTLNVICNSTMQVNISDNKEYIKAYGEVIDSCTNRFFSPIKKIDFLYKFTSEHNLLQKNLKITRDFRNSVISQRRKEIGIRTESSQRLSLLDHLLQLSEKDAFTEQEIRDEVQTILTAGSDTVGCTVSLGLFELAKHPEVQKKMLEESNNILGTDPTADVNFDNVHDLRYTECVFKEMLRFHAPVPLIMRKLESTINFDDLRIPAGANIIMSIMGTHLSESNFSDPEKFDPDRHNTENCKNIHPYAFIPFGAGPRICIGQKYATLEAKVLLSKLVRSFEILPAESEHKLKLAMAGTLKSANGVPIRLIPRQVSSEDI